MNDNKTINFIVDKPADCYDVKQGTIVLPTPVTKTITPPFNGTGKSTHLPDIHNAAALLCDNTIQMPPELIQGVLHKGLKGVLGSCSKACKTWILLDIALSVASG